jgi:hypothetical protein
MWNVVLRAQQDGEDATALYEEARHVLTAGKVWREHEAVWHPRCDQIVGYRKVNNKDWFIMSDEGGLEGPFPTRKLCLSKLREKSCSRGGPPGVYLVPGHTLFTRDAAEEVGMQRSDLP